MKQFNDIVTYVRAGKEIPALVIDSREFNGVENLELAYLDPDTGKEQLRTHGTVSKAFSVAPYKDGATNGWKEQDQIDGKLVDNMVADVVAERKSFHDDLAIAKSANDELTAANAVPEWMIAGLKAQLAETTEGRDKAPQELADATAAVPATETKHYADGSSATGPGPLPNHSPEGAPEVPVHSAADLDAVAAEQTAADATAVTPVQQ